MIEYDEAEVLVECKWCGELWCVEVDEECPYCQDNDDE